MRTRVLALMAAAALAAILTAPPIRPAERSTRYSVIGRYGAFPTAPSKVAGSLR